MPAPPQSSKQLPSEPDVESFTRTLTESASSLERLMLHAVPEQLQGQFDMVSADPAGTIWISGWLKRGLPLEFGAVIVDRQRYVGAVILTSFARSGVPAQGVAVVGTIMTEWRPSSAAAEIFIFFGQQGRLYIRSAKPFKIVPSGQMIQWFESIKSQCQGGRLDILERLVAGPRNWLPSADGALGFSVQANIEDIVVVPFFGCFVEGWVASPVKAVERFILKLGSVVLPSDANSLYFKSRSDVEPVFPKSPMLAEKAGFVAVFLGNVPTEELANPIVKVIYEDGASTNHPVDPANVRLMPQSATTRDLLRHYPALSSEWFYRRLARAIRQYPLSRAIAPAPLMTAPAKKVIVFTVSADRSDAHLLFDQLAAQASAITKEIGFAFVAARNETRRDIITLVDALARITAAPLSLFLIDEVQFAFYGLTDLLIELDARQFVFVGADIFLTESGWRAVGESLAGTKTGLQFFEVRQGTASGLGASGYSADCFAWMTSAFAKWASGFGSASGGVRDASMLIRGGRSAIVHKSAARRTRAPYDYALIDLDSETQDAGGEKDQDGAELED